MVKYTRWETMEIRMENSPQNTKFINLFTIWPTQPYLSRKFVQENAKTSQAVTYCRINLKWMTATSLTSKGLSARATTMLTTKEPLSDSDFHSLNNEDLPTTHWKAWFIFIYAKLRAREGSNTRNWANNSRTHITPHNRTTIPQVILQFD